jgi:hypothetical protein
MEYDPHSGLAKTTFNLELVDTVRNSIARDCRLTLRIMASKLNVNKESIRFVFTTDLSKKNLCEVCAPQYAS